MKAQIESVKEQGGEMKYTKGEWKVNEVYRCVQSHDDDIPLFAICYFGNHELERKNIANANLIAAAPDQNQALTEIDRWLIEHPDISDDPQLHIIHIQIQDALAKAEGK